MVFDRLFGYAEVEKEPDYIHTNPHDGRKYIDPDEFIKLPHVQEQMDQMEELLNFYQSSRVQEESGQGDGSRESNQERLEDQ